MKTFRASTLKKKLGDPRFVATASEIPKDKLDHVVTIHHAEEDCHRDYGEVGVSQANSVGYLIFEKPLSPHFPVDSKVLSINSIF